MFIQFFTYISLSVPYLIGQYELNVSKKTNRAIIKKKN